MKETKFKQTEVGMIPSDWEETYLGNIGPVKMCKRVMKYQTSEKGDIPFYKIGTFGKSPDAYISKDLYHYLKNKYSFPQKGTVLISAAGTIGRTVVYDGKDAFFQDSNIVWLENDESVLTNQYLYYLYQVVEWKTENGGAVSRLYNDNFKITPIAIPSSKKEQQRIAKALSDVDTLINNLEKLIAKKKNIKQGAMQQLLTGKKRLPGFAPDERRKECLSERSAKREVEESSGYKMTELGLIPSDWENVNISKTCTIKARIGWQGLKSTEYLNSGDYILVTGTDFKNGFIDWSTCSYVSEWRFKQDKNIQIKKGDVLVTKDGTIGKVAFLNEIPMEGTLNSGVFVVRSKDLKKIDSVYLSLVFKSSWFDNFLDEITSGSTIVHLYQKDFVKFNFPIPSSIEEQTAIANVLSDMDAEISALETKLAKYRTLKTGMMQQLLTGKIRLV